MSWRIFRLRQRFKGAQIAARRKGPGMNGEVISIGHELLMGEIVDTNSSFFAQRLAEAGVTVKWFSSVGDNLDEICEAMQRALTRSDVTITSGGLGPTSDDLTREAVARVLGEEMKVDPSLLLWLEGVFRTRGMGMPKTNVKQATLIPSATTVPNPTGTAPGWWVTHKGRHIVLTPGPPREIERMWQETIGPRLAQLTGAGVVFTRTLKTYGISEGGIDETLTDLFGKENPYLGIYARPDGIHLRIISKSKTRADAARLAEPVEKEIARRLGSAIWGTDGETPASRAIALLASQRRTLALADCATGGHIAMMLASAQGHGGVLRGALVSGPESGSLDTVMGAHLKASDGQAYAVEASTQARKKLGADIGLAAVRTLEAPQARGHAGITTVTSPASRAPAPAPGGPVAGGVYFAAVSDRGIHTGGESRRWPQDIAMQRAAVMALIGFAGALVRGEV